jgi:hypothetical protein
VSSPSVLFESPSCSLSSSAPSPRPPSRPPAQERGPRRRPEPRTITRRSRGARRSPTRAGGFMFAEPMAPAPLLSVPWRCPGHQRLIREAWERAPLLHYGSQVNPVRFHGRSHQLVGSTIGRSAVNPPSVSVARHQEPRLFPDSARARLTICARVRQFQSSGGASHRRQTAADTSASGRCPVGGGSSPTPAAR